MPPDDEVEKSLGLSSKIGTAGLLELSAEMMKQFGGTVGIVKKMRETWDNEATTPAVRQTMMQFIAKTMTEANEAMAKTDYQEMTYEELREYANLLIAKNNGTLPAWPKE